MLVHKVKMCEHIIYGSTTVLPKPCMVKEVWEEVLWQRVSPHFLA